MTIAPYDIIIPAAKKDCQKVLENLPLLQENLPHRSIVVLASSEAAPLFQNISNVRFLDENRIVPGMTLKSVSDTIIRKGGKASRAGWYFQQFLKLGYATICSDDYYLLWDADTIPLRPLTFLDGTTMLFNRKEEHHPPYFETIRTLFHGKLAIPPNGEHPSFISEGMIIDRVIMQEMLQAILSSSGTKEPFWRIILGAIPEAELSRSGFSEFETYGYYLLNFHPDRYRERLLRTQRNGYKEFGRRLSVDELRKLPYDTISFEEWDRPSWKKALKHALKTIVPSPIWSVLKKCIPH